MQILQKDINVMNQKRRKENQAGFTLIELLIAATIIGILSVFATVGYRNSVAETRVAQGRGKVQALAMANMRAHIDYPGISFDNKPLADSVSVIGASGDACKRSFASNPSGTWSASCLVANGYLDQMGFEGYFKFTVSGTDSACLEGSNSKLGKYKGYKYCYNAATSTASETKSW